MPGVTLHLDLAHRVLARARDLPFDPANPLALNAFRQGAFGPDLGYFPGCWRPLSDLAHCVNVGDLARWLVGRARTPAEHAFAAGWVTHILADHAVHPLIGCAVGALLHGRAGTFVDGHTQPAAHVRVEAGLDAYWAGRCPELRHTPMSPVFDGHSIRFLADAYAATYRATFPRTLLLRSHRLAAVQVRQGLALSAWSHRALRTVCGRPLAQQLPGPASGLTRMCRALGHRSRALAFLLPVRPSEWLATAAEDVVGALPDLVLKELATGLSGVENWNLDSGRLERADPEHGGRRRGLAALAHLEPDTALRVLGPNGATCNSSEARSQADAHRSLL